MALVAGARFGAFEIASLLGVGGMGEVYLARDTRLGRDVAIKILPAAFTNDADRLARFEREARALASLNHPNIAAIYGVEEIDGVRALVLELVEGETLDQRLRTQGALPPQEALAIARQIAEALDVAHEKGIVHRDLKPANVKFTPDGDVKVLDFGLAKAIDAATNPTMSEAATMTGTQQGVILGTAAYMSPEQARGQAVDKRTDVWAFGCVLYEMLTARQPFEGETLSDSIARTLSNEPDWAAIPASTPPGVMHLLKRCLEKDPKRRLRGLGDIGLALDVTPAQASPAHSGWKTLAVTTGLIVTAIAATFMMTRWRTPPPQEALPIRFEIPVSIRTLDRISESGSFVLSPDGRRLVILGTGADGVMRIWERALDSIETRPINGTEGEVAPNTTMFWSPDSRSIAFYSDGAVKRIDRNGGVPQLICRVPGVAVGGSWNRDGRIVLGSTASGLLECPANGGTPTPITIADSTTSSLHLFPNFLPDGRHLLYLRVSRKNPSQNGLYIADRTRQPGEQRTDRLLETGFGAIYATESETAGRILFVRDRALWAVRFRPDRLALVGEPVEIASPIGVFLDGAFFQANGSVLVYRGGSPDYQLMWRNRKGDSLGMVGEPGQYTGVTLAPDETRAVVVRENRLNRADQDLWMIDLRRNRTSRFTSDPLPEAAPVWAADSKTVMFVLGLDRAAIVSKPLDGTVIRELLPATVDGLRLNSMLATLSAAPNGRFLAFRVDTRAATGSDIWLLPLQGDGKAVPLLQQESDQMQAAISPGDHWLAYVSNESGVNEVFVRPLTTDLRTGIPTAGAASLISRGGGTAPRWRADGRELFYHSSGDRVMAAPASPTAIDTPVELFQAPGALSQWGVSADGQKFLMAFPAGQNVLAPFSVVLNWQAALK